MKAILRENGSPSGITTLGRMNARAGGTFLVDRLSNEEFADMVDIVLDWVGDGLQPAMVMNVFKWFPKYDGKWLELRWVFDIDEIFGADNADNELLLGIVDYLKEEFTKERGGPLNYRN